MMRKHDESNYFEIEITFVGNSLRRSVTRGGKNFSAFAALTSLIH
jgi:hypothetical protein